MRAKQKQKQTQCLPRCEGCGFLDRCFNCPRRAQDRDCGCQFQLLHRADDSQHIEDGDSLYPGIRRHSSRRYRQQPSIIEQHEHDDDDGDDDDDEQPDNEDNGVRNRNHEINHQQEHEDDSFEVTVSVRLKAD